MYDAAGTDPSKRLALFEQNQDVISARDDSLAHEIALLVSVGKYDEAIQRLTGREFSVWEGANLDVAGNWTDAHILRGRERLSAGKATGALADFQAALQIPSNLPSEGVELSGRESEIEYWIGEAYRALGKPDEARTHWLKSAGYQPGVHDYYRACSLRALGQTEQANTIFGDLTARGDKALIGYCRIP